jgi:hypothetical protein
VLIAVFLLYTTTMANGKKRLTAMERTREKDSEKKINEDLCEERERERERGEKTAWVIKIKVIEE